MIHKLKFFLLAMLAQSIAGNLFAQKDKQVNGLQLTTGVGVNKFQGPLGKTFRSTVAFNSGFEKSFRNNWYGQLEVNFNSLKYDQQQKDSNSDYLFQNTNSSLFMAGLNVGKDFRWGNTGWFNSVYTGTGYINIGEPRISLDQVNNIITQSVVRRAGILGKGGTRIGYTTKSKLLQTIYIDGSYWISTLKTNDKVVRSISVFLGIRMAM
jgi:hypothetical protein